MKSEIAEMTSSIESMPFDQLLSLRETLEDVIARRIGAEERELEERLDRIRRLKRAESAGERPTRRPPKPSSRKLPVRYRNPENPNQAWAGRGLQPRWLKQAIKSGKQLSYFLVVDPE